MNDIKNFWYELVAEKAKFSITWRLGIAASIIFHILIWSIRETYLLSLKDALHYKPLVSLIAVTLFSEIILTTLTATEILFFKRYKRTCSFRKVLIVKNVFTAVFSFVYQILVTYIFANTIDLEPQNTFEEIFNTPLTWGVFIYWLSVANVNFLMLSIHSQTGMSLFSQLGRKKYHEAFEEERVFMFIDMIGSTTIAEKIGSKKYFELLNEIYYDISFPIGYFGADVYQYVGDEVVVSWDINEGIKGNRCILLFEAIQALIEKNGDKYEERYSVRPKFKGALHAGGVTTGEVGYFRTAILHSGDVLNTSARMEKLAGELKKDLIISEFLLQRLDKRLLNYEDLGAYQLTGKQKDVHLYGVATSQ